MKTTKFILMVSLIGILALTACAQQRTGQAIVLPVATAQVSAATSEPATPESTPVPQSSPADVATQPAADGSQTVTLEDRGKTITMNVGESFLLKLGEVYVWDVSISDQNVLSRVKNIAVIRGSQGVYQANQAGTVTLAATGDPTCRQSKPACAMPSLLFTITVVVK